MVPKTLPKELTSYDLLKTLAVLLMVIDHTGYYFFDGDEWWRVFGRFCVPIWFFLIGYAQSRDLGPKLWIGMIVLVAASWVSGMGFLPPNILATVLVTRMVLDKLMERAMQNEQTLWQLTVLLTFLIIPTSYAFEYGTLAIILAMYGWLYRHRAQIKNGDELLFKFFVMSLGIFILFQTMFFDFSRIQIVTLGLGSMAVMIMVSFFKPVSYPSTSAGWLHYVTAPVRLIGRHTLEIYVFHLLLFKLLGVITQPERFQLFNFHILMP